MVARAGDHWLKQWFVNVMVGFVQARQVEFLSKFLFVPYKALMEMWNFWQY
jgi:hypothetical protein